MMPKTFVPSFYVRHGKKKTGVTTKGLKDFKTRHGAPDFEVKNDSIWIRRKDLTRAKDSIRCS